MKIAELLTEAPKGPDWKVLYKVRDRNTQNWNTGTFTLKDYVGKDRAKAAAQAWLEKKYKDVEHYEPTITRITQLPWKKI